MNVDWSLAGAVVFSGLIIVFFLLCILIGAVTLIGNIIDRSQKKGDDVPSAIPAPAIETGIAEETVAVISAAIQCMSETSPGTTYKIASINRHTSTRPVWGFAGMQQNTRPF